MPLLPPCFLRHCEGFDPINLEVQFWHQEKLSAKCLFRESLSLVYTSANSLTWSRAGWYCQILHCHLVRRGSMHLLCRAIAAGPVATVLTGPLFPTSVSIPDLYYYIIVCSCITSRPLHVHHYDLHVHALLHVYYMSDLLHNLFIMLAKKLLN